MEKNEKILAGIKNGILIMLKENKERDEAFYKEHEYHSGEFDRNEAILRQIQDMIFRIEVETVQGTEVEA